jgi:hypothetical protein
MHTRLAFVVSMFLFGVALLAQGCGVLDRAGRISTPTAARAGNVVPVSSVLAETFHVQFLWTDEEGLRGRVDWQQEGRLRRIDYLSPESTGGFIVETLKPDRLGVTSLEACTWVAAGNGKASVDCDDDLGSAIIGPDLAFLSISMAPSIQNTESQAALGICYDAIGSAATLCIDRLTGRPSAVFAGAGTRLRAVASTDRSAEIRPPVTLSTPAPGRGYQQSALLNFAALSIPTPVAEATSPLAATASNQN